MRLIDADALEELFRETISHIAKNPKMSGNLEHMVRASAMVIEMIKDAPTIEQHEWIPCSDRMPELYKPVLVTGGDIIWICELIESPDLDDGEFQWEDKMLGHWYSFDNWDAWMPLPEPYKGEEE